MWPKSGFDRFGSLHTIKFLPAAHGARLEPDPVRELSTISLQSQMPLRLSNSFWLNIHYRSLNRKYHYTRRSRPAEKAGIAASGRLRCRQAEGNGALRNRAEQDTQSDIGMSPTTCNPCQALTLPESAAHAPSLDPKVPRSQGSSTPRFRDPEVPCSTDAVHSGAKGWPIVPFPAFPDPWPYDKMPRLQHAKPSPTEQRTRQK
jgi:hypothetical protein